MLLVALDVVNILNGVDLQFWVVDQKSIPYMGKVVLTNVSVQHGIVNPNAYGLLECPGKAMPLPAYYAEVIHSGLVTSGGMVVMY